MERLSTDFFGMEEGWTTRAKHIFFKFFGLIFSLVALVVTLVVLLQGDGETTPCPNCTWLSCVTFPPANPWWYCDECGRVTAEVVSEPQLHLEIDCPSGKIGIVDLSNELDTSRNSLQKKLPSFCREYCMNTDELN